MGVVERINLEDRERVEVYADYENGLIIYRLF